jgi:beta-lactamase class D
MVVIDYLETGVREITLAGQTFVADGTLEGQIRAIWEAIAILLDVAGDKLVVVNRARAEKRTVPASTFKVVNSLIALETGAVRDENEILPYGGKKEPIPFNAFFPPADAAEMAR